MSGLEALNQLASQTVDAFGRPEPYGIIAWVYVWIFTWAGIAKIRQPVSAAEALVDFRLVKSVRPRLGLLLGVGEVALAVVLASGYMDAFVTPVVALLLWFFVFLIARALARGANFACFCFGRSESRLSTRTAVRTGVLAVGSVGLLMQSLWLERPMSPDLAGLEAVSGLALVSIVALLSVFPILVMRTNSSPRTFGR